MIAPCRRMPGLQLLLLALSGPLFGLDRAATWLAQDAHRTVTHLGAATAGCMSEGVGMRQAERWAIANEARSRAETAPEPRTLKD